MPPECHLSHLPRVLQECHWHQPGLEVPFLLVLQEFQGFRLFLEFRSGLVVPVVRVGLGRGQTGRIVPQLVLPNNLLLRRLQAVQGLFDDLGCRWQQLVPRNLQEQLRVLDDVLGAQSGVVGQKQLAGGDHRGVLHDGRGDRQGRLVPSPSSLSSVPLGCTLTRETSDPTGSESAKRESLSLKKEEKTDRTATKVAWEDLESCSIAGVCIRIWKKQLESVTTAPVKKLL